MKNNLSETGGRMKKALLSLALIPCLLLSGCSQQSTIAALVSIVGTSVSTVATLQGNPELATQIQTDTQTASQQVLAWKSGTSAQNAIAALSIVQADLSLLPIKGNTAAYVDLALGTIQSILAILPASAPVVASHAKVRTVSLPNPPKDAKAYKKAWNAELALHPVAGLEPLK